MAESIEDLGSLEELRQFVRKTLCERENLLIDQFAMSELRLQQRGVDCGLQFSLHGPRSVRLGAVWAADHNTIYFYDAGGTRFGKVRLTRRFELERDAA